MKKPTLEKWLRRPNAVHDTIYAWLAHNDAVEKKNRPDTMTVDLYTSQVVPVNSLGKSSKKVTIFCPDCNVGRDIDMNRFWERRCDDHEQRRTLKPARCKNEECMTVHKTLEKWLRRPHDEDSTIYAWLAHHNVLQEQSCPDTMTVAMYMEHVEPVQKSTRKCIKKYVQIFCPKCSHGRQVDMNLFWERQGDRCLQSCKVVRCHSKTCVGNAHPIRDWLRRPHEPKKTIKAWLEHNCVEHVQNAGAAPVSKKRALVDTAIVPTSKQVGTDHNEKARTGHATKQRRLENKASPSESSKADAEPNGHREAGAGAAEKRREATWSRGISNVERAKKIREASKSIDVSQGDEIFGSQRREQLRDALKKSRSLVQSSTPSNLVGQVASSSARELCYKTSRWLAVSETLQTFLRLHFSDEASVQALEVGGRGDCLFHSIGAALQRMLQDDHLASRHIHKRSPTLCNAFKISTDNVVQHLRKLSAESFRQWEDLDILNFLVGGVLREELGEWPDGWSPTHILQKYHFDALVGCDAVRAVGEDPESRADSGDLKVALTRTIAEADAPTSIECFVSISQGQSLLVALREELIDEFKVLGNNHWGTVTDCAAISESLDVGFVIFADKLQNENSQCLVNVHAIRGDFKYFIALWWDEPLHFRLAQYKEATSSTYRSFWSPSNLPPLLRDHYNDCYPGAPIGSLRRLGVS